MTVPNMVNPLRIDYIIISNVYKNISLAWVTSKLQAVVYTTVNHNSCHI